MSVGPQLIVLGEPSAVESIAAAEAVAISLDCPERAVLLLTLAGAERARRGWAAPASAAVARCCEMLEQQGVAAKARGRLVTVLCEGDGASATADRLIAVAQLPVVVASLRPRDAEIDRLVSCAERLVVAASADPVLDELALSELTRCCSLAELAGPPNGVAARAAAAGIQLPRWVRSVLSARLAGSDGQAAVELVAAVPIMLAVALAAAQLLAAGVCRELAAEAAGAGAAAMLQGRDPKAAARSTLPGWTHGQLRVTRHGRQIDVGMTPPSIVPGLARLLSVEARADAGPPA